MPSGWHSSLLTPHSSLFTLHSTPLALRRGVGGEAFIIHFSLLTFHFILLVVDEPAKAEADAKLIVILVEVNHSKQVEKDLLVQFVGATETSIVIGTVVLAEVVVAFGVKSETRCASVGEGQRFECDGFWMSSIPVKSDVVRHAQTVGERIAE